MTTTENQKKIESKVTTPILSNYTILKELAKLESQGGKQRKVLDTNNIYSLGLYHFQARTVKDMYRRYYGKNITIDEGVRIAEDDTLSTELAHDAIFKYNEKYHWELSFCRMNNRGIVDYQCKLKNSRFSLK